MEISIILNIVFVSLLVIGFVSYTIWLGFTLVKVKKQLSETELGISKEFDLIYTDMKEVESNLTKKIDRLDSKSDREVKSLYDEIGKVFDEVTNRIVTLEDSTQDKLSSLEKMESIKIESIEGDVVHRPIAKD